METLKDNFVDLTRFHRRQRNLSVRPGSGDGREGEVPKGTKALDQFTINLTDRPARAR